MHHPDDRPDPARPDRRAALARLAAGGALAVAGWSAPSIVRLPSSGAAAGTCNVPDLSFTGTGGNGWTSTASGLATNGLRGFTSSYRGLAPAHVLAADALALSATLTASKAITLTGGRSYTFSFAVAGTGEFAIAQTLAVLVNGVAQATAAVSTTTIPGVFTTSRTFTYVPATTGTYTLAFRHTIFVPGVADDLGFGIPTVLCT